MDMVVIRTLPLEVVYNRHTGETQRRCIFCGIKQIGGTNKMVQWSRQQLWLAAARNFCIHTTKMEYEEPTCQEDGPHEHVLKVEEEDEEQDMDDDDDEDLRLFKQQRIEERERIEERRRNKK